MVGVFVIKGLKRAGFSKSYWFKVLSFPFITVNIQGLELRTENYELFLSSPPYEQERHCNERSAPHRVFTPG